MWTSWDASQRDLFFLDSNGDYVEHYNITNWDDDKIYNSINNLISGVTGEIINVPDDYPTIQLGLNASSASDTVLVQPGTYYENIVWVATNGIKLIGSGEDDCFIDGDSLASVIRFEDDLGGIIDSTTFITGFTVRNGFAGGDAGRGGGMYLFDSSPTLLGVTFSGNTAGVGGGMYLDYSSNLTLTNVTFSGNTALFSGGMYISDSSPTLTDVIFSGNTAVKLNDSGTYAGWGGGMEIYNYSNPTLTGVTFSGNTADHSGGGMYIYNHSNPTLTDVTFSGNTAVHTGGGIFSFASSSPTLTDVIFSGNTATSGGGMSLQNSSPTLTDVTFIGNTAYYGGGMWLISSSPTLTSSILWDNSPLDIQFSAGFNPNSITITYSDIQGGEEEIVTYDNGTVSWGDGNIDADPLFCDPTNGDFSLAENSPCIGTGQDGANMGALGVGCTEPAVYGCITTTACNFDADANTDDGSCTYAEENYDCDGNQLSLFNGLIPENFNLHSIYPNPFNPVTNIIYGLPEHVNVQITVYDLSGKQIETLINEFQTPGYHSVNWNADNLPSGVYLIRMDSGDFTQTQKVVLVK